MDKSNNISKKEGLNKGRRGFMGDLTKITLVGASLPLTSAMAIPETREDELQILAAPYLQDLSEISISITFIMNNRAHSWVEYGEKELWLKAESTEDGFVKANNRLNKIRINGLTPNTTYKYRVMSREIIMFDPYELVFGETLTGDIHTFRTPKKDSDTVSCVILNDIHDRPYSFSDLLSLNKDFPFDFVALNGDMFDHQTDEQQLIDHLITPCTTLFASHRPFLMIRGNHETRGKFARNIKDYFTFPDNEYYFSFKQGPVHWIVLDTGEDKEDETPVYGDIVCFDAFREKQAKWLEEELQSLKFKNCKFRVVLMHIPPFYSGDWHGTTHCRKLFHPIFENHGVNMVISGHTHRYGVHPPSEEHNYPIIIGGGPKTGNRTLIQFKADDLELEVQMIRDDGTNVGKYRIGNE
ncbi:metallophosphoesterase [Arenibacter sp. TNZ]|uniref:metallophosphoesterase n=1 Tax=Arenibacter TaxID=178469 RepID=UPI000CD44774|nr:MULTISPECIES: metallophosphoesterase [Arenibacter]MCM4172796.1 metallophosphoesterase [Arenibacter sp. TNZ]